MAKIRVLVLDVINNKGLYETYIDQDNIDDIYKEICCDCFDVAYRKIGDKWYDIFCDDEGLFKESSVPSAIYPNMKVALVGNLLFANHNEIGETTGLSDDDIHNITMSIISIIDIDIQKSWDVVQLSSM